MTDDYLKEDKETAIKTLDKQSFYINKEELAKVDADKKSKEKVAYEVEAQQQVEPETQLQEEQEISNQQSYKETPQQNHQ